MVQEPVAALPMVRAEVEVGTMKMKVTKKHILSSLETKEVVENSYEAKKII